MAKIYDPLYYAYSQYQSPEDVAWKADSDYSMEAAAYEYLDTVNPSQRFAPKYYKSWTFTLPLKHLGTEHQRAVRLVLMEYIEGCSMMDLFTEKLGFPTSTDAWHLPVEYRLEVLGRVLDAAVRQFNIGLGQEDLAPRNVMISPRPHQQSEPIPCPSRIALIDYNQAVVYKLVKTSSGWKSPSELPDNPMKVFGHTALEFSGWTPPEWDQDRKRYWDWLKAYFGGKRSSSYAPMPSTPPELLQRGSDC